MYTASASIYDAIYHFKDYGAAVGKLREVFRANVGETCSLLDVGCGTGKHLEYFSGFCDIEGLDLDERMLDVARQRCPNAPLHQLDMVQFDLGRTFDVVTCLFSAVAYVRTLDRMERAVTSMARHVRPGGILVIEPWISAERYRTGDLVSNYVDNPDLKVSWMYVQEKVDSLSVFHIHYLVGTSAGITCFTETHEMGLFSHEQYMSALRQAGIGEIHWDTEGLFGRGLYVGIKRGLP